MNLPFAVFVVSSCQPQSAHLSLLLCSLSFLLSSICRCKPICRCKHHEVGNPVSAHRSVRRRSWIAAGGIFLLDFISSRIKR